MIEERWGEGAKGQPIVTPAGASPSETRYCVEEPALVMLANPGRAIVL